MKKILFVVATLVVLDFVALLLMVFFVWHPLLQMGSRALVLGGDRLAHRHQYAAAIVQYDQALRLDPQDAQAYVERSYAHTYLGQVDAAIADSESALALHDPSGAAYGARGWAREWKGDWDGAHADYDVAIKDNPNVAGYYAHRGWARFRQHENDGAMTDLNQALHLAPHLSFAYHDRAWLKFMNDDLPGALEDEDAAIEFSPHDAEYYLRRADFRLRSDDADGALADTQQALELQPQSWEGLYRKAIALRRLGNTADSVIALDQLLQLCPNYSGALFERAMARYAAGDLTAALADLKANRVNERDRPATELWLWVVNTEEGAKSDADRELEDYLKEARDVQDGTWPEQLGDMLLGRTSPETLAALPEFAKNGRKQREELCNLWFFAAKAALARGDKATAKTDFQKALATRAADIVAFNEARRELAAM
jgi:tetratricopeptide (TPR) repeat protein